MSKLEELWGIVIGTTKGSKKENEALTGIEAELRVSKESPGLAEAIQELVEERRAGRTKNADPEKNEAPKQSQKKGKQPGVVVNKKEIERAAHILAKGLVPEEIFLPVVQGNQLIDAEYDLPSLIAHKLVRVMISKIKKGDDNFKLYRIHANDLVALGQSKRIYAVIDNLTEQLMHTIIRVPLGEGKYRDCTFIPTREFTVGKPYIDFQFNPKLKPYLLQLKKKFTQTSLNSILSCTSMYELRLYEILKSHAKLGFRYIPLDRLRGMLGIKEGKYKRFADFKRRILEPTRKAFSESHDISFVYKAKKEGNRVVGLRFSIMSNIEMLPKIEVVSSHDLSPESHDLSPVCSETQA